MSEGMILVLFFISIFFFNMDVHAKVCTPEEVRSYVSQANKIIYKIDFNKTEKYIDINLYNLSKEMVMINVNDNNERYYLSSDVLNFKVYDYNKITSKIYSIYLSDRQCSNDPLRNIEIIIPKYNLNADSDYCQTNPEDKCCKELLYSDEPVICKEKASSSNEVSSSNKEVQVINNKNNSKFLIIIFIVFLILTLIIIIIKKYIERKDLKERGMI